MTETFFPIVNDRATAHQVLDAAQLGVAVSSFTITRALMYTGDLSMPHRNPGARAPSPEEDPR